MIGRRVFAFDDIEKAGDYCLDEVIIDGVATPHVWFLLPIHEGENKFDHKTPGSGLHGISEPPWVFRECPDGSLEVRESIACGRGSKDGEYWHGYLDEGHVWRAC
jgi:hypothetical protein